MVYDEPINRGKRGGEIYESIDKHNYSITVDVARGVEKDYSALLCLIQQHFHIKLLPNIETTLSNQCCFQMSF